VATLGGCTPAGMALTVVATTGTMALQERGLNGAAKDTAIRAEINHEWLQRDHVMYMRLTLQVWEGRVLVGGALDSPEQRAEAIQLAWKPGGVREVINEVQVVPPLEVQRWTRDRTSEISIMSRLTLTRDIASINYSLEVTNGVVSLLGVAHDQAELERVIAVIRDVPNVRRIANHVLLRDDPRRFRPAPAA